MGSIARSGTWDEASSPAATRLARRFEDAWRDPRRRRNDRPDPLEFLPEGEPPPSAWLALLRADLNLRWDEGETVRVEDYRKRFPGLDAETMVALCYEEFCRREEDGRAPFPSEYEERFPDLHDRLRRVFDIHELVGNAASTDLHIPGPELTPFPEARQTIAGFHLVEELGRGSFARVFLAQERQLADRPVALKVARTGSREPQTLARLQHTHIVPVHSYRIDPATGLHLLCMPYFGRVTLARLLADPKAKLAPTGAELIEALDRLDPPEASNERPSRSSTRDALARLPFARAIAWWGSRLADALAHAHDRGVLHRDIKPSNVLVTSDGLPMLLDFNLAGEPWADRNDLEPDHLGGTVAYMAPEHLEAVSLGEDDRLDARADIFSLGVLLFEALTGSRPFPSPSGSSVQEALQRAAEARRRTPPRLRDDHPEIPAPLERVIRRCLEPEPSARYPNANELAADLQAVADDAPLRWTREPLLVRAVRRGRRSWKRAVLVAVVAGAGVALLMAALREEADQARVASTASALLDEGKQSLRKDNFSTALARFDEVSRLTNGRDALADLRYQAIIARGQARLTAEVRGRADALSKAAWSLRFHLIGSESSAKAASEVEALVAPFRVLNDPEWARAAALTMLDPSRKTRLFRDIDEILFLYASGFDVRDRQASLRGIALCDRAKGFAQDFRPWQALRNWLDDPPITSSPADPQAERSAQSCFEWGVLLERQGRMASAIGWLDRAAYLEPGNAWYQYHLATTQARSGDARGSLVPYGAAIALEPANGRFRIDRARVLRSLGEWARAQEDEKRANHVDSSLPPRTP
jgi:eukaryotic-like serine/threonine-protein kinase